MGKDAPYQDQIKRLLAGIDNIIVKDEEQREKTAYPKRCFRYLLSRSHKFPFLVDRNSLIVS